MPSTLTRREWQSLIKTYAEVASHPGVYVLGCFARHVTLYSQQVRAFNLVYGLHVLGKVKKGTRVAVIGAGAAGLAAAGALAYLECDVTLLEETEAVLTLQANSVHRWIHPRIYDWPTFGFFDKQARLPIFDWTADKADEVVRQIRKSWKSVEDAGRVKALFSVNTLDLSRNRPDNSYSLKWEQNGGYPVHRDFDRIILAVGFGLESERKPSLSYWSPENLDDANHPKWKSQRWLISGFGDGALADLMRVCIKDFRYANIVPELESTDGIGGIKEELKLLHAKRHSSNKALSNSFYNLSTDLPSSTKLEHKLKPFLRQQGPEVFLTGTSPDLYGRGSSILNRLIVLLLSRLGAFTYLPGPSGPITPVENERYQVSFGYPAAVEVFDRVIVRHGTVPVIKVFTKHHMGERSCDKLELAWSKVRPETDFSRLPQWPLGYFGVQDVPHTASEDAPNRKASAPRRAKDRAFEEVVKHFGMKMSQLSFYKELRGDGSSTVTYAIEGLTSVDKPIAGLHFHFESYAGKIGPPILDPAAERLGISWKPDAPPPDGSQEMDELRGMVCKTFGTLLFSKPLGPSDPPLTFSLQIIVLNGDALSAWEFDQLYSKEDQKHVDLKPLRSPTEYFYRFVWCPVETLKVQVTLPSAALGPVTASMFALPEGSQIDPREVLQDSIAHLYPRPESQWNPNRGDWERPRDKTAIETMSLANPAPQTQTWALTVKKPAVGSCYSLDWKLPTAIVHPPTEEIAAEAKDFRSKLLSYGRSRGVGDGFPATQKRAIRRLFVQLHGEIDGLQRKMSFSDPFDIEFMTYDDDGRRLQLVDEICNGKPVPRLSKLWFPFGLGLAGACFKQGDAPYFYYRKLVDEKRLGPEYYLNTRQTKAHKGMVSVPLIHPRWYGPAPGETVEASRLCIGVVDISFEGEPRWLNALRSANNVEVEKLQAVCRDMCDQLCLQLAAV